MGHERSNWTVKGKNIQPLIARPLPISFMFKQVL